VTTILHTRAELSAALARQSGSTALVPTMGALHEGHASLMRLARERVGTGAVVVSVFVNPLQFGAGEDLARYPRTLGSDVDLCTRLGVDVVFAPGLEEVYPDGEPEVTVAPGRLGEVFEGASRPGHFEGVLTVVAKLFGLVGPQVAVFGEKDYQQLALVRQMVRDLSFGIEIIGAPTVREPDGLAMSSRNRLLTPAGRAAAGALHRGLVAARYAAANGGDAATVLAAADAVLSAEPEVDVDYLALTDPGLVDLPRQIDPGVEARVLIAARVGSTRLIDNLAIEFG
jgi:pantoate--beta-alanine ligase